MSRLKQECQSLSEDRGEIVMTGGVLNAILKAQQQFPGKRLVMKARQTIGEGGWIILDRFEGIPFGPVRDPNGHQESRAGALAEFENRCQVGLTLPVLED